MSLKKRAPTYGSYEYLERGVDYPAFELAAEIDRVEPALIALTEAQERRVETLVRDNVMISLHEYLGTFPADISETPDYVREGRTA